VVEQPDDVHERRLAGSGRPHDRQHLALANVEGHPAEGVDLDPLQHVRLRNIAELEHGAR